LQLAKLNLAQNLERKFIFGKKEKKKNPKKKIIKNKI